MKVIRCLLIALWALYSVPSYADQMNMSIGIDLQVYPELVLVPDSPVYYAPQLEANYFFYDGEYWVYQNDTWYVSSWYDGPWWQVNPEDVPDFVLRVPVRFYLMAPTFFISWWSEEPPHWGEHWGHDWEQHRRGWDRWDHHVHPQPAPLPVYQRHYTGDRYPRHVDQQHELQRKHYSFQPLDPVVQRRHQETILPVAPIQSGKVRPREERTPLQQGNERSAPHQRGNATTPHETIMPVAPIQREKVRPPEERTPLQQGNERFAPHQQGNATAPHAPLPQRGSAVEPGRVPYTPPQKQPALQEHRPQPQPNPPRREQKVQKPQDRETIQQGNDGARETNRGQGQDKARGWDK
jgi:hypothetical protein